jgi:GST-like protein
MTDDTKFPPENNFPPAISPQRCGNGKRAMAAASPTSTGRSPARRMTRNCRSASTRCSSIRWPRPNGVKVTVMLEELLAAGHKGAEYDAWLINIGEGNQFGSGFVDVNPNSKIPALMDHSTPEPTRLFESGSILMYLAEKFGAFLPKDHNARTETHQLADVADGLRPVPGRRLRAFLCLCADEDRIRDRPLRHGGQAPARRARPASGTMSTWRGKYSIADMAIWPWYGTLMQGGLL